MHPLRHVTARGIVTDLFQPVKDYYAILGVPASATTSEIKKAFRRLAVRYHPDKNPAPEAKPRFQEINEAYDVLGDPEKRASYDVRLANPLADLFSEPTPAHPDPAYRRRRKPAQPPTPKEPPATWILMRDSLKYVMWVSRTGLLVTVLFFVDYFIPYQRMEEVVEQIYSVRSRGNYVHYVLVTRSGKEIKVYDLPPQDFERNRTINTAVTRIYGSVMAVSNSSQTVEAWVGYMYSTLIFFPILLFVNSILAFVYRKRVEFCFNLNVTAFVLLIINLILI